MNGNYSLSDVAAVSGNTGHDNSFFWIFALLILGQGGLGGFGNRNTASEVTGFQLGELSGRVADKDSIATLQNTTNQGFAGLNTALANGISTTVITLSDRINSVAASVASCCCELQRQMSEGFGQVKFDLANYAAQTNERILLGNQRILDALAADKADRQNDRIRTLELQAATCNIVRYPNQQTFNAGPYPTNSGCY